MRIARIWGWRRIRQQAGRLLALHQAEVRFDRFLDSVACIIATHWQRRRVVPLYGQLHCVCNRIRGFPSCLSGWEHLRFCPPARKAFPEVRGFKATPNSNRVLMNYSTRRHTSRSGTRNYLRTATSGLNGQKRSAWGSSFRPVQSPHAPH